MENKEYSYDYNNLEYISNNLINIINNIIDKYNKYNIFIFNQFLTIKLYKDNLFKIRTSFINIKISFFIKL
jgi:hypothetical protein